jgi:CelD/BcsL family acetyltransferase involved in cellulose biosynthesis
MVRVRIHTSIRAIEQLRRLWEFIDQQEQTTIFQNFDWNLLAARQFSDREEPFVVVAEASYGLAIVPAARLLHDDRLRLLGEELFDYRHFLHHGEPDVLRAALSALARAGSPLEIVAMRECDKSEALEDLEWEPFSLAPSVTLAEISAERFAASHLRLARNLRRLERMGFRIRTHSGDNSSLLRSIYEIKAQHDPVSLFRDQRRVDFMMQAGRLQPERVEVFTIESETCIAAALVTFREPAVRRFYTCSFSPEFAKLSPAMALIHRVTYDSLQSGMDCDYMTGEQGYKLRLATGTTKLFRLKAKPDELAALWQPLVLRPAV